MPLRFCLPFLNRRKQSNAGIWPPSRSPAPSVSPEESTRSTSLYPEGPPPAYFVGSYVPPPTAPTEPPSTEIGSAVLHSSHLQSDPPDSKASGLSGVDGRNADRRIGQRDPAPTWADKTRDKVAEICDLANGLSISTKAISRGEYASESGGASPFSERRKYESSLVEAQRELVSTFRDAQVDGCTWARVKTILDEQSADDTVRKTVESVWKYALPMTSRSRALTAAAGPSTASVPSETEPLALTPPDSTVTMNGVSARGQPFAVSFNWINRTGFE